MTKILTFDGSGRKGSFNHQALLAVSKEAEKHGATLTHIHLTDYDLPLYNGDIENEGLPEKVVELRELFKTHDAFLMASPEYNGGYSPLLKNALDWVSRPYNGEPSTAVFKGKVAGLIAAAPGKLGGLRGLAQLNTVLWGIGVVVLPNLLSIAFAKDAFDEAGNLKQENDQKSSATLGKAIVSITKAVKQANS